MYQSLTIYVLSASSESECLQYLLAECWNGHLATGMGLLATMMCAYCVILGAAACGVPSSEAA
jgi:lipoate synthase